MSHLLNYRENKVFLAEEQSWDPSGKDEGGSLQAILSMAGPKVSRFYRAVRILEQTPENLGVLWVF
jgi:hypothetical protein